VTHSSQRFFHCWNASWNAICVAAQFSYRISLNLRLFKKKIPTFLNNAPVVLVGVLFKKFDLFLNTCVYPFWVNSYINTQQAYNCGSVCCPFLKIINCGLFKFVRYTKVMASCVVIHFFDNLRTIITHFGVLASRLFMLYLRKPSLAQ
jgi:hypothetical protein